MRGVRAPTVEPRTPRTHLEGGVRGRRGQPRAPGAPVVTLGWGRGGPPPTARRNSAGGPPHLAHSLATVTLSGSRAWSPADGPVTACMSSCRGLHVVADPRLPSAFGYSDARQQRLATLLVLEQA